MDKKILFNESLKALVELAQIKGNQVSTHDIHSYFKDILTNDQEYNLIYEYLKESKIKIEDLPEVQDKIKNLGSKDDDKKDFGNNNILSMYLDDLKNISSISKEDELILLQKSLNNDMDALKLIAESHLNLVIEIAKKYETAEICLSDLIQEGNLGLIEGISNFILHDSASFIYDDYINHLQFSIENAMKDAVNEQYSTNRIYNHLVDQANSLDDASSYLANKLGREPTTKELSDYLFIGEDEVLRIMKISLDALNIDVEE